MRYASAGAFRRALEMRLVAHARDTGRSVVRLRKGVAFDRLLARLFAVAPEKGALALDYRFGDRARTTKDVDLASAGDEASATAHVLAAQTLDLDDFFGFAIEGTRALDRLAEGTAVRRQVRAELAGRVFDEFLLDVGFDPPTGVELDRLRGPDLLTDDRPRGPARSEGSRGPAGQGRQRRDRGGAATRPRPGSARSPVGGERPP